MIGMACMVTLLSPAQAGCTSSGDTARDDCETESCGQTVAISWRPGDVPDAATYEVCTDSRCGTTQDPEVFEGETWVGVAGREFEPASGHTARVSLEALDESGARLAFIEGEAEFTPVPCCSGSVLRVTPDGRFDQIEPGA
jgi:hypothetical protein